MIKNYQQRVQLTPGPPPTTGFATITAISGGKARLRFSDGATSRKLYTLNRAYTFAVGDKVQIRKRSGTYVVEFPL